MIGWVARDGGAAACCGSRYRVWTPSVVVMEPGVSERIASMVLYSATSAARNAHPTTGYQQPHPELAAPGRPEEASAKSGAENDAVSMIAAADAGCIRDARAPAVRQVAADSRRRVVSGSACDAANVMVVRRDTADALQFPKSGGGTSRAMPRFPPQGFRTAHTRVVALLDGSRCTVIIGTGADVSLISVRVLRLGVKSLPCSERDGRITGVAQQGIAILGHVVLEVRLGPVRTLTPFVVALGVGFDAILGVDFLYEHGISVNLAQHCLVFEAHDGLIVPLVDHHPRFKHACALTRDVALYPGGRALVRCACGPSGRKVGPPQAPEVCLVAARRDKKLGLVVSEPLTTGSIEVCSAADYPLYLPAGWKVARVRDCHFVPYGPPRLLPRQQRIVNLVAADGAGESPALAYGGSPGSTAADSVPGPKRVREPVSGPDRDPRPDLASNREPSRDVSRRGETSSAEWVRTPDREARPPRPRPVSPGPDRAPAPAAERVKSY